MCMGTKGGGSSGPTYHHSLLLTRGLCTFHSHNSGLCMVENSASQIGYNFTTRRNSKSPIKLLATVATYILWTCVQGLAGEKSPS